MVEDKRLEIGARFLMPRHADELLRARRSMLQADCGTCCGVLGELANDNDGAWINQILVPSSSLYLDSSLQKPEARRRRSGCSPSFNPEGSARVDLCHTSKRGERDDLQSATIEPRRTVSVMDQIERIPAARPSRQAAGHEEHYSVRAFRTDNALNVSCATALRRWSTGLRHRSDDGDRVGRCDMVVRTRSLRF
jgi:hypothetical protein